MKNIILISVWAILFSLMGLGTVSAAGEMEYILEKKITAMTPLFMPNHIGDLNWIQGFQVEGEIFLKGSEQKIGSFSGEGLLTTPPMNLADSYSQIFLTIVNEILGIGSFTVTAMGVALSSSAQNGDTVLAWSGSISNGTGAFENNFGLSAGNSVTNVLTGVGAMTEVLNIRNGL